MLYLLFGVVIIKNVLTIKCDEYWFCFELYLSLLTYKMSFLVDGASPCNKQVIQSRDSLINPGV